MDLKKLFKGSIIRNLINLFALYGLIPAVVIGSLSALLLFRQNQSAVTWLSDQLESNAEQQLAGLARARAERYNQLFLEEAHLASQVSHHLSQVLSHPEQYCQASNWDMEEAIYLHESGWWVNGPESDVGVVISPEADWNPQTIRKQQAIAASIPLFKSIIRANQHITSVFTITEDQTIWIHPNRFWEDDTFYVPRTTDLTQRPYYRETTGVVWSRPYIDVEPVITAAAPIRVRGDFQGMAGVDFSLTTILEETLQTQVGEGGFMFLVDEQAHLIAMPQKAERSLLRENQAGGPEALLGSTLFEIVPDDIRRALEEKKLAARLGEKEPFLFTLDLKSGPAYLAFSPMPSVPWYVAVVQPTAEVSRFASEMSSRMQRSASVVLIESIITGIGFILVIVLGGLITYRRLALPIQELAKGAEAISQGQLNYRVPPTKEENELSVLTATFNEMAASVQQMQQDIKEQESILRRTLKRREGEFDALTRMTALLNRQEDLPRNFNRMLEITRRIIKADLMAVTFIEEEDRIAFSTKQVRPQWDIQAIEEPHCEAHIDQHLIEIVVQEKSALLIDNLTDPPYDLPAEKVACFQEIGVDSVYLTPVLSDKRVMAVVSMMWEGEQNLNQEVLSFIDAMTKNLSLLIEHTRLRRQSRDLLIVEERQRLARELHDSVTQNLFTLHLTIEGMLSDHHGAPESVQRPLQLMSQQVEIIQQEMRSLINELRPIEIAPGQFETELRRHITSLRRTTDIEVELDIEGIHHALPPRVAQNLNRITQEALNNVAQHSQATRAQVSLTVTDHVVELLVKDNGLGFEQNLLLQNDSPSLGLISMRERAEMLNGVLIVRSEKGEGTSIKVKIPLQ